MERVRGRVAALVVALALAGGAAGCTGSSSSSSGSSSRSQAGAGSVGGAVGSGAAAAPAVASGTAGSPDTVASPDRQVVTTASARLRVRDVSRAVDAITHRVEAAGGHVERRFATDPSSGARGTTHLVLRVPASSLQATLDALPALGTVAQVDEESSDVTATSVDLTARISALQASTARLEHLLATAATTADLVAAEGALTDRQAQLESLQAQSAALAGRVALSTLTLTVVRSAAPGTPASAGGFTGGLARGWHALAVVGAGLLVVLGALVPWLVAAAVLTALVVAVVRAVRRVRRRPVPPPAAGAT